MLANTVSVASAVLLSLICTGCDNSSGTGQNAAVAVVDSEPEEVSSLPPDPGEAGRENLEGVDSDSDGVRDDVQILIATLFPDEGPQREAAKQLTISVQNAILNDASGSDPQTIAPALIDSSACSFLQFGDDAQEMVDRLENALTNTPERLEAYILFNEALAGFESSGGLPTEEVCDAS